MTRREDDKRGNREFGDDPNARHYEKIEARFDKDWCAKVQRDHQGRDVFPPGRSTSRTGKTGATRRATGTDVKIEIDIEDLRRLYDLATDSPLMCSGSFETDDVRVLRRLGRTIGADLSAATPDEFVRDFPHDFKPSDYRSERRWIPNDIRIYSSRWETEEEALARFGGQYPDACTAGALQGSRRCGRPADHPIHQPDAPEPTSDPDDMIDDE